MALLTACRTHINNETVDTTAGLSGGDSAASALTEAEIVSAADIVSETKTPSEADTVSEMEASPTGFSAEESYVSEPVTFVWEEVGFGGDFVVTLEPFNTFQMCEGPLSSTIYRGYFDVDGDIVTLRDSATSEGFKNFRFRINDDRTELTFIADGSDSLPLCRLEDGALFSTKFHHDISEYWESESKHDDSKETDAIPAAIAFPAVMVNGELYFSTGEESTVSGRCGNMDGTITSTVDGSAYPTEDNQSNFGGGAGYQYGSVEDTIEVYMADESGEKRWIVFQKRSHSEMAPK